MSSDSVTEQSEQFDPIFRKSHTGGDFVGEFTEMAPKCSDCSVLDPVGRRQAAWTPTTAAPITNKTTTPNPCGDRRQRIVYPLPYPPKSSTV